MTIKIVTDSACDVPPELAEQLDITVVPVYLNIGQRSFLEGVEMSREQFYGRLHTFPEYPTTAAPAVGTFTQLYEQLTGAGASQILSMHIAHDLSATYNAARVGAAAAQSAPVTLFDTRQITLGAGLLVLLAAEAAKAGQTINDIVSMLNEKVSRTRVFGMIDSLEALHRSGRVSWAQFGIGSLLQIKPIMMIADGVISAAAKVRTRQRALRQMMQMVAEMAPFERLAIIHVNAQEAAEELYQLSSDLFASLSDSIPLIQGITPAVGTHLGVGAVGFAAVSAK
ncbi:MAG: DegV family protein [Ardenticatenaceae bacterium]|nr:DegV family protein [Anaerolineales bacterium]MCB8939114.1 DegV family protein [Ardenticatenaceae bacterium]MCB8974871.1 DegV family protein [Ardenticatenaceae bacterium]